MGVLTLAVSEILAVSDLALRAEFIEKTNIVEVIFEILSLDQKFRSAALNLLLSDPPYTFHLSLSPEQRILCVRWLGECSAKHLRVAFSATWFALQGSRLASLEAVTAFQFSLCWWKRKDEVGSRNSSAFSRRVRCSPLKL